MASHAARVRYFLHTDAVQDHIDRRHLRHGPSGLSVAARLGISKGYWSQLVHRHRPRHDTSGTHLALGPRVPATRHPRPPVGVPAFDGSPVPVRRPSTIERCGVAGDLLHRVFDQHLEGFLAAIGESGRHLPRHVERELRRFTTCGDPDAEVAWLL